MNTTAISLGDSCIDHYLPPIDKEFVGGNALNVSVYMQRAGLPSAYVGYVGNDHAGELILQALQAEGVDISHVHITKEATKRAKLRLTENNEPMFIHEKPASAPQLNLDEKTLAFMRQCRLVHTSWLGGAQAYLPALKSSSLQISIDYGEGSNPAFMEATLPLADVAYFSMPQSTEDQARAQALKMSCNGHGIAVVTRAGQGSLACLRGKFYMQPAYPVQVVDTLGAGDAFIGTFLANLVKGESAAACLERAARAAAHACTHHGAWYGAETG